MNHKQLKKYLTGKPEAYEDYPFGADVAVFKVKKRMFATLSMHQGRLAMNLKCDPHRAAALRDIFEAIIPGYHMNKLHWNTVFPDHSIPQKEILKMIDHSYALVVKGLKKTEKNALLLAYGEAEIFKEL